MDLANYFQRRAAECRDQLSITEKPRFALKRVSSDRGEVDITEQHRTLLRRAIEDDEKAAAIWRDRNAD